MGETEAQDGVRGVGAPLPLETMPGALRPCRRPGPPASGMDTRSKCSRGQASRGGHRACSRSPLRPSPRCPHGPRQRPRRRGMGRPIERRKGLPTALGKGQDTEEWGAPSGDGRGSHKPPRGVVSVIHLHTWPKFTEQPGSRADSGLTARLGGRVRRCRPGRAAHSGRGRPRVGCKRPWA